MAGKLRGCRGEGAGYKRCGHRDEHEQFVMGLDALRGFSFFFFFCYYSSQLGYESCLEGTSDFKSKVIMGSEVHPHR